MRILVVGTARGAQVAADLGATETTSVSRCSVGRYENGSFRRRGVQTQVQVSPQAGQEGQFVVELNVADEAVNLTAVFSIVEQTQWVAGGQRIGATGSRVEPFVETTEFFDTAEHRLRWVECRSTTNSTLIGEAVVDDRPFGADINAQAIVEKLGREVQRYRIPLEVRRFQHTILGSVAIRQSVGDAFHRTRHADVVVAADARLVNLILPVGVGRTQQFALIGTGEVSLR